MAVEKMIFDKGEYPRKESWQCVQIMPEKVYIPKGTTIYIIGFTNHALTPYKSKSNRTVRVLSEITKLALEPKEIYKKAFMIDAFIADGSLDLTNNSTLGTVNWDFGNVSFVLASDCTPIIETGGGAG